MIFEAGMNLHGFTVKRVRQVEELSGTLVEMIHEKSGAELCFMDNKTENKLFSVAFKTLPEDSTGVFHILEHSVLCGSEKYPVREPFVELLKSSMNTFLNAMTYPDKTIYPVSSRNRKDFLNLMSVYLDAVFAPAILHNPNIFYQEGWHTEIDEDGKASYKGVVFNEMKGAMSEVDERIEQGMMSLLFPDNWYQYNYGGDPAVIPDLTYEKFVDTYRRFYHPSNAKFFLDGDVPLDETLEMIDSYLKKYESTGEQASGQGFTSETESIIVYGNSAGNIGESTTDRDARIGTEYYEISDAEDMENSAILALGKVIGTWEERVRVMAMRVLCDFLADSNESPLCRAILSSGISEDLEMTVMDGIETPYLMVVARNMADKDSDEVRSIIRSTVEKLLAEGLNRDAITASINRMAFRARQNSEPQGLNRALSAMDSWLYGGDPLKYLINDEAFKELRRMSEDGGFEKLLQEMLLDETGLAVLHMLPSVTLGEEQRRVEEKRLAAEMDARSEGDKKELIRLNEELLLWQQTPDSPEQIATLPTLSLSEVSDVPEDIPTVEKTEKGVTVLYHPIPTNGIIHLSMYFSLTDFELSELTKVSLLPEFLGELSTKKHSAAQLQQEVKTYIGNLSFGLEVFAKEGDRERCTPVLMAHADVLAENKEKAEEIIGEILTETCFDNKDSIREIVMQIDEDGKQMAVSSGHALGAVAVQAHYTSQAAVKEAISGYTFLKYLHQFAENFDEQSEEFISLLEQTREKAVCRSRLIVSITATEYVDFSGLFAMMPEGVSAPVNESYTTKLPKRMGIRIPAQVAFAVKGYQLKCCDMENRGDLRVVSNILSLSYLWNEVRVQGGAYGCGLSVGRNGNIMNYSFRDPSPADSLEVYDKESEFLRSFCESDEDLDKYIISTIASSDPLLTPNALGHAADEFWFSGVSYEDRKQTRRQMLTASKESLLFWCKALDKMAEDGTVCVVGYEDALKECGELEIFEA